MMIRIAILEDIGEIRRGITSFLETQPEFEVVASIDSVEAFDSCDIQMVDVILCDIGLPGKSGIEGIKLFKRRFPNVEVIILTVFQDEDNIYKALVAGATGYLLKSSPIGLIKESIISIMNGEVPMSKAVARKVLNHFNPQQVSKEEENLTTKEKQVLTLLTEGLSYKLIADRMAVSIETTRTHIKSIYKKLQINSKSEAVLYAMDKKYRFEN